MMLEDPQLLKACGTSSSESLFVMMLQAYAPMHVFHVVCAAGLFMHVVFLLQASESDSLNTLL